jgi:chromosome segregation ATPase
MRPTTLGRRREPTVRLIAPEDQPEPGPDGRIGPSIDQELRAAAEHLTACREAAATSRSSLADAQRAATECRERANVAQRAFQEARDEARRADLAMRQQQRRAANAKMELRRALEWAARLEGTLPSVEIANPPNGH